MVRTFETLPGFKRIAGTVCHSVASAIVYGHSSTEGDALAANCRIACVFNVIVSTIS